MTTDEQMNRVVRSWLRDTASSPHTASHTVTKVLSRLPSTRQRGRWWPLPSFGRRSDEARGSLDLEAVTLEGSPHPIPIVRGRTFTMLSPTKAIIAGALVALGGLFMVAQPLSPPAAVVPGAESAEPPVAVSAAQECTDVMATPVVCSWDAGDERLTGTLTHEWVRPQVTARLLEDDMGVGWASATLEGPEGSWAGHMYAVWADPAQVFIVLSGDGAYDGWQFLASTIDADTPGNSTWTGVMYQGELPPFGLPTEATAD